MRTFSKVFVLTMLGAILCSASAVAQQASVDSLMNALYSSISFDKQTAPDYARFKSLFTDGAQLINVKDTTSYTITPANYEKIMSQQQSSGKLSSFKEQELYRTVDHFGNIMQVFSTYETHVNTPQGPDSARGINSLQLIKKKGQWKISTIIWYQESKQHPIPKQYLPETAH